MKKFIYVGGGLDYSTILFLLPIIEGYYHKNSFFIFDKATYEILKKIIRNKDQKKKYTFLDKIIFIDQNNIKTLITYFLSNIIEVLKYLKDNFVSIFFFSYSNKENFNSIFIHCFRDSCMRNVNDDELNPNFFIKIKTFVKLLITHIFAVQLSKKFKIHSAFLGHTVYAHRALFEKFKKDNVNVYIQANFSVFKQLKNNEIEWNFVNSKLFNKIKKKISKNKIKNFWNLRLKGKLNDQDYLAASQRKNFSKYPVPKNAIFLHVFRDSPFASIDKDRIFFDYYHWIIETLKVIKESNEKWLLRTHPSCMSWGENSYVILKQIEKKFFNGQFSKNIIIDNGDLSNLSVLKQISRCVTFSGTAGLEASCYGVKPIVIAKEPLTQLNMNYALKPRNLDQYKKLLLKKSHDKIFKQKANVINKSKYLLYSNYKILSCKQNLVNSILFPNSSKKEIQDFNNKFMQKVNFNHTFKTLKILGQRLEKNKRTFNFDFIIN